MYNSTYSRTVVHAYTHDHLNVDVYILAFIHTGQAFYTVALIRGGPKEEEEEEQVAQAWLRNSQEKLQVLFNDIFFLKVAGAVQRHLFCSTKKCSLRAF
jgi:hypothetical protein